MSAILLTLNTSKTEISPELKQQLAYIRKNRVTDIRVAVPGDTNPSDATVRRKIFCVIHRENL